MPRGVKGSQEPELTPEQFNDLVRVLKLGMTVKDACSFAGTTTESFYKWKNIGATRPKGDPLREFADAVAKGRTQAKVYAVGSVTAGMKKDWKAAAWYLSVSHPQEYGPKVRVTLEKEFGDAVANLEEDFAEQPEVLGKILASLTRQRGPGGDGPLGVEAVEPEPGTDPTPPGIHTEPE